MKAFKSLYLNIHIDFGQVLVAIMFVSLTWLAQRYLLKPTFSKIDRLLKHKNSHFYVHLCSSYEPVIRYLLVANVSIYALFEMLGIHSHDVLSKLTTSVSTSFAFWGVFRLLDFYSKNPTELTLARNATAESVLLPFFCRFLKYFVLFFAFAIITYVWGYDLSGVITGLGIGSLAIAFGTKDVISNMFGGIAIAMDKPFAKGDWISTQDRKIEGLVEEINFRSTKILTFDKAILYVPNTILSALPIINWTRREVRRVMFQLAIQPHTSEPRIRHVISRIKAEILAYKGVHPDRVDVFIDEITEAGLMLKIVYFTNSQEYSEAMHTKQEVCFIVQRVINEEGVQLSPVSQHLYWNRVV